MMLPEYRSQPVLLCFPPFAAKAQFQRVFHVIPGTG
jgi:hypothetical protein